MGNVFRFNGFNRVTWFNMGRITNNDRCLIKTIKTETSRINAIHRGPKKQDTKLSYVTSPNIMTDCQNSFTVTLSRKFEIKTSLQIPPHLNGVDNIACPVCLGTVF